MKKKSKNTKSVIRHLADYIRPTGITELFGIDMREYVSYT